VENYSNIVCPLLNLTKKATTWHWGNTEQQAFDELKNQMCSSPILWQPDFSKQFFVQTNALANGVGAILSQEGEIPFNSTKSTNPCLHPVAYYSATFTPIQKKYDIYERELLAIIKAFEHWRHYLTWGKHQTIVLTDHANLGY
jgi:hypothetical protein